MGLRRRAKKLQKAVVGHRESFELVGGERYTFNPGETSPVMMRYFAASARAVYRGEPRPEAPELIQRVAMARDRGEAFHKAFPEGWSPFPLFDAGALIERGEIVPRPLVPDEKPGA